MPTVREPDNSKFEDVLPEATREATSIQTLVGSLIENSEELARALLDLNYTVQTPVNENFERCLRLFIVQLKKFQNEL